MNLIFKCDCGNEVEARKTTDSSDVFPIIRFEDSTHFSGDENGYVMLTCGKCGETVEVRVVWDYRCY